ncbi:MAG: hypothetical protein WDO15_22175 [Bacteroidota bacterium]
MFIKIDGNHYEAEYVFNSILFDDPAQLKKNGQFYFLKTAFQGGWGDQNGKAGLRSIQSKP